MTEQKVTTIDGNEAAAYVAYRVNEICTIYPITPSSTMAELADQWASDGIKNIWGSVPLIVEMQHEGGAAGAAHGALQTGALTTTFTASQGLLLMIPNMYKIAGELTAAVFHVAARSLATQGLSIFGDHQDVMAIRQTGFCLLASASVQEAHDMALIAQAATLEARIPFIHFFDGFRTSHEVNKIFLLSENDMKSMISDELVIAHRTRALSPENPFIRGTAQNPDTYFQARETVNTYYAKLPYIVQKTMDKFYSITGRRYNLFDYFGDLSAESIIIIMGSATETVRTTVDYLNKYEGTKLGILQVRLYQPLSATHFIATLPSTVKSIAVLERTKEPGATGEPMYLEVVTLLSEAYNAGKIRVIPRVIGGRYGLSSKDFTPAMCKAVFVELSKNDPKNHFTVGIIDDVTHTSLEVDSSFCIESDNTVRAMFFGLGADGTVGANKNSIKIIGDDPEFYAQGYFVYDSKKSGSQTVSHLRFGHEPIKSPYLIQSANFIGIHQLNFINRNNILQQAAIGAVVLLNTSPYDPEEIWDRIPYKIQEVIILKKLELYGINANKVARENGMGSRINTIMQTCFFAISKILTREKAIEKIKYSINKTYSSKGTEVVQKNFTAVDHTLVNLKRIITTNSPTSKYKLPILIPDKAPDFVKKVTAMMIAGRGDELPVSALPVDGTYPSATTKWEKRNISNFVPIWDQEICIQCGNCSFVCPHGVIRSKFYHKNQLNTDVPVTFKSAVIDARGFPETRYTLQVYLEDCTGCSLCVEACPVKNKEKTNRKAINMGPKTPILLKNEIDNISFFESIPDVDRGRVDFSTVRGVQFLPPLFEFSGACAGCGETPYVKLLSQLFGDRLMVANATGCSSIYGGNQPTTPWAINSEGRGPAWSNSLFEDNAEFGLGFRLSVDKQQAYARELLTELSTLIGNNDLIELLLNANQITEIDIRHQRQRVAELRKILNYSQDKRVVQLLSVLDYLVKRSIWIVGGDGWAYDIGSSGLDHVLASGRNINILVLDTEVYSNTGGQMSKSTPLGAVAKFAASGKLVGKKDLALQAISYGNVYVARIAFGANPQQTLLAFREAETYDGPSLILAYSHCIAHGINMQRGLDQQRLAVESGHWPLLRYNPAVRTSNENPFILDSTRPKIPLKKYAYNEVRYKILTHTHPKEAEYLIELGQQAINQRWSLYEEMASLSGTNFNPRFKINN